MAHMKLDTYIFVTLSSLFLQYFSYNTCLKDCCFISFVNITFVNYTVVNFTPLHFIVVRNTVSRIKVVYNTVVHTFTLLDVFFSQMLDGGS